MGRGTRQDLASHQEEMRRSYLDALGGFEGFPDRATPLAARITATVVKDGYRVEKILFESQPGHYVTAALFLPTAARYRGKRLPAVLLVSGHSRDAKGYASYQKGAALAAIHGLAVFAVDPIEQGERVQIGKRWGTSAHIAMGVGSILVGRSTATYEIWDNIRAIDYLTNRPDIDPGRIGVMGNSGGGTQTSQLLPADGRIKAAAPASYICSLRRVFESIGPGDSEQHQFGELVYGKDHVEYLTMRAPTPVLVAANKKDFFPIDGTRETYAQARRFFERLGAGDRIAMVEHDGKHGWHRPHREASVAWMLRWLKGEKRQVTEAEDLSVLSAGEIRVTRTGHVRDLPGYVSTYALNAAYDREVLAPRRERIWRGDRAKALARVRQLANVRPLAEMPAPRSQVKETLSRGGYTIAKVILTPEDGIVLPGLLFRPGRKPTSGATLYLNARGKVAEAGEGGAIERLVRAGRVVLALDLRGIGETRGRKNPYRSQDFAQPYHEIYVAYGLGMSFVGMRAEDILVAARWLLGRKGIVGTGRVDLRSARAWAFRARGNRGRSRVLGGGARPARGRTGSQRRARGARCIRPAGLARGCTRQLRGGGAVSRALRGGVELTLP
ncbi:MAG: acetylxylan esterase [Planctomycetota bacterium]